jgi:hypothetical protein
LTSSYRGELVTLTEDGEYALFYYRQNFELWNMKTNRKIQTFSTTQGNSFAYSSTISFSPTMDIMTMMNNQGEILIWNVDSGSIIGYFNERRQGMDSLYMDFSPDGQYLIATDAYSQGNVWDIENRKLYKKFPVPGRGIHKFSHNGDRVISTSNIATYIYDFYTGEILHSYQSRNESGYNYGISSFIKQSPGKRYVLISGSKNALLLDLEQDAKIVKTFKNCTRYDSFNGVGAAFIDEGKSVLIICSDGTRRVWDISDLQDNTNLKNWRMYDK